MRKYLAFGILVVGALAISVGAARAFASTPGSQYAVGTPQANAVAAAKAVYPGAFAVATAVTVTDTTVQSLKDASIPLPNQAVRAMTANAGLEIVELSGVVTYAVGPAGSGQHPSHNTLDIVVNPTTNQVVEAYSEH